MARGYEFCAMRTQKLISLSHRVQCSFYYLERNYLTLPILLRFQIIEFYNNTGELHRKYKVLGVLVLKSPEKLIHFFVTL